jgi:hypothetical protein
LSIVSRHEIKSLLLPFDCFTTFNKPQITVWFLCLRMRQQSIESAMDLAESFTWEDLPTRDADGGHLTAAGWIPLTMKYSINAAIASICFHTVQSTIRIVTNHETQFNVWYPFDWTVSPFYELVNISQVTGFITELSSIYSYSFLKLRVCVNWYFTFFPFFTLSLFPYFPKILSEYRALSFWLTKKSGKEFNDMLLV